MEISPSRELGVHVAEDDHTLNNCKLQIATSKHQGRPFGRLQFGL
jgi:hypothetical protein